ncbi:MAG: YbhB/YbcL family Raf kinase inhibitor-like protein [Bacteroidota bacterium]
MKKVLLSLLAALCLSSAAFAQTFTLHSSDLGGQATMKQFFNGMNCTGENISPNLRWENAPTGTKYYALTIFDKDAPTGSGFWHWVVFNIPASTTELKTGAGDPAKGLMPAGAIQSVTDFGKPGYGGPCPPPGHGLHHYEVTVFALKDKINLDEKASPAFVGFNIWANTLAKASMVFYAERK